MTVKYIPSRALRLIALSITLASVTSAPARAQALFPACERGKCGYIDATGAWAIRPTFTEAGPFRDGLAAVRTGGTYGFVDSSGSVKLPALWDFAEAFAIGKALVYASAKLYYIDRGGRILFEHAYAELRDVDHDNLIEVKTARGHCGVTDLAGRLLVDTAYSRIESTSGGVAVAQQRYLYHTPDGREYERLRLGAIDTAGSIVAPFGKYVSLHQFSDDYGSGWVGVAADADGDQWHELLDRRGVVTASSEGQPWMLKRPELGFAEGLALVESWAPSRGPTPPDVFSRCLGVVDTSGRVRFENNDWWDMTPFNRGRAFVADRMGRLFLIDRTGKVVNDTPYAKLERSSPELYEVRPFAEGYERVETANGWRVIDTNGRESMQRLLPGDAPALVLAPYEDGEAYFDRAGEMVWREPDAGARVHGSRDLTHMPVVATEVETRVPGKLSRAESRRGTDSIEIVMDGNPGGRGPWRQARLSNPTKDSAYLSFAGDAGIVVQAQDRHGAWRDVEYRQSGFFCGDSFSTVSLGPGAFWRVRVPVYSGSEPTMYRVKCTSLMAQPRGDTYTIYGAPFAGTINPGQFWRRVDGGREVGPGW